MTVDVKILPYGTAALADGMVRIDRNSTDLKVTCPAPFIVIEGGAPATLRLNGDQYRFGEPPDLRTMTDADVQMEFLVTHLSGFCDLFAKVSRNFLVRYFAHIAAMVEAHRAALEDGLTPFGGIYDYRDWMLSAPRPLPRAHLPYDDGAKYAAADFGFIVEGRCVAVSLDEGQTPTGSARERHERLAATGAELITVAADTDLAAVLPAPFREFWLGQHLPSSPFKGVTLGDIVPA